MLWWNQHLWWEYKLIKPDGTAGIINLNMSKRDLSVLWRTPSWPWSATDLPLWGRFCGVKTTGSHRAHAQHLLDHTPYLGPCTSLCKWPCAHVRNFTGLFPVCFPTGGLCYLCVHLWPGGVANWSLIAGPQGKPEAEVFTGKHERLYALWSRTRGKEKERDGPLAVTCTEYPSLELQASMNANFETGLPGNDEGIFVKVER